MSASASGSSEVQIANVSRSTFSRSSAVWGETSGTAGSGEIVFETYGNPSDPDPLGCDMAVLLQERCCVRVSRPRTSRDRMSPDAQETCGHPSARSGDLRRARHYL